MDLDGVPTRSFHTFCFCEYIRQFSTSLFTNSSVTNLLLCIVQSVLNLICVFCKPNTKVGEKRKRFC